GEFAIRPEAVEIGCCELQYIRVARGIERRDWAISVASQMLTRRPLHLRRSRHRAGNERIELHPRLGGTRPDLQRHRHLIERDFRSLGQNRVLEVELGAFEWQLAACNSHPPDQLLRPGGFLRGELVSQREQITVQRDGLASWTLSVGP